MKRNSFTRLVCPKLIIKIKRFFDVCEGDNKFASFVKVKVNISMKNTKQLAPAQVFTYLVNHPDQIKTFRRDPSEDFLAYPRYNAHSNFLYVYFYFSYHLLNTPFRFQKVGDGKYEMYKRFPQQVLCGISNICSIYRLVTSLRSALENVKANDPISFFLMFCECSSFVFKVTVFKGFWRKGYAYLQLIQYLNTANLVPYNPFKIESVVTISIYCGMYSFISFLRLILGSTFLNISDWSPSWWYRRLVAEARYSFFLSNGTSPNSTPELSAITSTDTFLAIIQAFVMQFRFITGFFVDLYILVHVLSLWAPSVGFANIIYSQINVINRKERQLFDLGSSTKVELDSALRQFDTLKNLSVLVGEAVGDAILPYIGEALFYYAIYFDDVVMTSDVGTRLVLTFFYMSAIFILMFSAEIVRRMRWFKSWLCENGRLNIIDQNHLAMVLDDLANHSVGITASGIFTVNYQFVGTIVSVLITYFIIRLQSTQSTI